MSDMEEPPVKVLKMEVAPSSLDSTMESQMEGQEEGQEEWLSEGVLTDDDYMAPNNSSQEPADPDANVTAESQSAECQEPEPQQDSQPETSHMEQNIEDTLNNFEGMETTTTKEDAFDELLKKEPKDSEPEPSDHQSDDGHNTDDLLRMLGEDDSKKKKVLTTIREKNARRAARSSEDEIMFDPAKVTKLKVAKNAIIRKQPIKAEPEDLSDRDSDMASRSDIKIDTSSEAFQSIRDYKNTVKSDDDGSTVKIMFTTTPRRSVGQAQKSRPCTSNNKTEKPKPTPLKQNNNSKLKSLLKPQESKEHPEIKEEEEFLEEDDFDLDDDTSRVERKSQPIRRPERMDEEVLTDEDSSEDDSLYDVMPSSDSEDLDDWFTLDIRAERAGDYLPWLGDKAHKLLMEEKHRVSSRLAALRQSVTALQSSGRVQSDQIKVATEALHELDAMLAAA